MAKKRQNKLPVVSQATALYVRVAPRKMRLVADLVRGKSAGEALQILAVTNKKSAVPALRKVINSAMANVNRKEYPNPEDLIIGQLAVDGGPMMKRWRARAMGRANLIRKRTCYISLTLNATSGR